MDTFDIIKAMKTKCKIIDGRELRLQEDGKVYSYPFTDSIGRKIRGKFLSVYVNKGRRMASVQINRRVYPMVPARVVAEVMLPDWDEKLHVDHRDGNPMNDRPCNLRMMTHAENQRAFKSKQNGASSIYRGVSRHKSTGKWHSQLTVNGKPLSIGLFANETDAAKAYDAAAIRYGYSPEALNINKT